MFGLDPQPTSWRAAVASISLLSFGSAIRRVFSVLLKERSSRSCSLCVCAVCLCVSLSSCLCVCCFQQRRHAHSDAALVARQHRNVGGRISCPQEALFISGGRVCVHVYACVCVQISVCISAVCLSACVFLMHSASSKSGKEKSLKTHAHTHPVSTVCTQKEDKKGPFQSVELDLCCIIPLARSARSAVSSSSTQTLSPCHSRHAHARLPPANDVISMPHFMSPLTHEIAIMCSCPACDHKKHTHTHTACLSCRRWTP